MGLQGGSELGRVAGPADGEQGRAGEQGRHIAVCAACGSVGRWQMLLMVLSEEGRVAGMINGAVGGRI